MNHRGALAALASGIIVAAGPVPDSRAALTYAPSLGAGVFVNDNLYLDPDHGADGQRRPVSETMYSVAPALDLGWVGEHDHLNGAYRGEYWQFTGDENLDPRWRHGLAADLGWRRWAPFFLEVRENLALGPTAQRRDVEAAIDYTYTNVLMARTGLFWDFGARATAELAYRLALETYPQVDDADRVLRQYAEGTARYRWSPLWETEARLSYGRVARELTADYDEFSASAAVNQRVSEHLVLLYGLEWLRDAYGASPADDSTPEDQGTTVFSSLLWRAGARGDLSPRGTWSLGYQDDLDYLQDGDTLKTGRASAEVAVRARLGSTLTVGGWRESRDFRTSSREETAWGATLDARWMITPWSAFDVRGAWADTTIRQEGTTEVTETSSRAAAGILLLLFKRLQFEAGYDFRKNDSSNALRSYSGSRLYALLTCHFRPLAPGGLPASYLSRLDDSSGGVRASDPGGTRDGDR